MGNDSTVFVMVVPSEPFRLFWAEDQATLISYGVQNRWKEQRDYRIVSMLRSNFEDIELPAGSYTDEVWEYKEGVWITESEQEILESNLDYEMDSLIHHLESARKILKVMTGDDVKDLRKAIDRLLFDPEIPKGVFEDYTKEELDDFAEYIILAEKINYAKYIDKIFPKDGKKKGKKKKRKPVPVDGDYQLY